MKPIIVPYVIITKNTRTKDLRITDKSETYDDILIPAGVTGEFWGKVREE